MPNKKAARKAIRQSQKNRARNLRVERDVREAVKTSRESIIAGKEDREQRVLDAIKKLDRGVAKGIIKKNTAARKKSRLVKSLRNGAKA